MRALVGWNLPPHTECRATLLADGIAERRQKAIDAGGPIRADKDELTVGCLRDGGRDALDDFRSFCLPFTLRRCPSTALKTSRRFAGRIGVSSVKRSRKVF